MSVAQPGFGGARASDIRDLRDQTEENTDRILAELGAIREVLERIEKHLEAREGVAQSISMG
ncbi:MAG: hypothetical protein OXC09_00345 [Truepera sp.]|nr:hypothetical protein [Truepera sp.]